MSDTPISFSALVGKTIASVDESCVNVKTLTFTDGTIINVEAEANALYSVSLRQARISSQLRGIGLPLQNLLPLSSVTAGDLS